ncbi:hypothetical protein A2U01_0021323, partial [Trifolium medium]|nr:hypothetical protein [Trifolium medium]
MEETEKRREEGGSIADAVGRTKRQRSRWEEGVIGGVAVARGRK